ncbi:MAG: S1 RNA-binding domain-containing protein [Oscillospiraceae bacterium]
MQLEIGSILEGKVSGIKKFGAFVDLDGGGTGMVHISEVANGFVENLETVLTLGQCVKVKVISISDEGKVALSIKKALPKEPPHRERADQGRTWQPKVNLPKGEMSFEDMLSQYKTQSEEKISDLKRVTEAHRGGGNGARKK